MLRKAYSEFQFTKVNSRSKTGRSETYVVKLLSQPSFFLYVSSFTLTPSKPKEQLVECEAIVEGLKAELIKKSKGTISAAKLDRMTARRPVGDGADVPAAPRTPAPRSSSSAGADPSSEQAVESYIRVLEADRNPDVSSVARLLRADFADLKRTSQAVTLDDFMQKADDELERLLLGKSIPPRAGSHF